MIKLINDDCLNVFKTIENNSIDLIIVDLFYNKSNIDFIMFFGEVFTECERVLKNNGSFYFFHNNFLQIVELQNWLNKNSKFIFKQFITYINKTQIADCSQAFLMNNYNCLSGYCLFYVKEYNVETPFAKIMKKYIDKLNLTKIELSQLILSKNGNVTGWLHNKLKSKQLPTKEQWELLCNKFGIVSNYNDLKVLHDKQQYKFNIQNSRKNISVNSNIWVCSEDLRESISVKPLELIENIIRHSSDENDIVLDCFMGDGIVGVACKNLKRKFIGVEQDRDCFVRARDKINSFHNKTIQSLQSKFQELDMFK